MTAHLPMHRTLLLLVAALLCVAVAIRPSLVERRGAKQPRFFASTHVP